jgi:hypothetical protein
METSDTMVIAHPAISVDNFLEGERLVPGPEECDPRRSNPLKSLVSSREGLAGVELVWALSLRRPYYAN